MNREEIRRDAIDFIESLPERPIEGRPQSAWLYAALYMCLAVFVFSVIMAIMTT